MHTHDKNCQCRKCRPLERACDCENCRAGYFPKPFVIWARRPVTINTDPQRRCYNGCNFSEETVWGAWGDLYGVNTKEEAEACVADWKKLNPTHEYEWRPYVAT